MGDVRVPVGPVVDAFGLPATVTRPSPDTTPIVTTGVWIPELETGTGHAKFTEPQPYGSDFRKREGRRVMCFPRAAVPTLPRGTTVVAAEEAGQAAKTWSVDGLERVDADWWTAILVRVS